MITPPETVKIKCRPGEEEYGVPGKICGHILISAEEYNQLKRRVRQAMKVEDLSPKDLAAIEQTEMPGGYELLDKEMR